MADILPDEDYKPIVREFCTALSGRILHKAKREIVDCLCLRRVPVTDVAEALSISVSYAKETLSQAKHRLGLKPIPLPNRLNVDVSDIDEMLKQGLKLREISAKTGVSSTFLSNRLRLLGIARKQNLFIPDELAALAGIPKVRWTTVRLLLTVLRHPNMTKSEIEASFGKRNYSFVTFGAMWYAMRQALELEWIAKAPSGKCMPTYWPTLKGIEVAKKIVSYTPKKLNHRQRLALYKALSLIG